MAGFENHSRSNAPQVHMFRLKWAPLQSINPLATLDSAQSIVHEDQMGAHIEAVPGSDRIHQLL